MQKNVASFTPVRTLRLSEEIIRQIARLIEDGSIRLHDRFPSERDLQERWQVSRPVLREAFRALEMQGVVESRPGDGRYLRSDHIPDPDAIRRRRAQESSEQLRQAWEAREAIEIKAAELAARNARPEQLAAIERALDALGNDDIEDDESLDFNREFHFLIARASGNVVIEEMLALLLGRFNRIRHGEAITKKGHGKDMRERHKAIYDAIAARDPEAARRAMQAHFHELRSSLINPS